jgi:general nucleoside transport system permease protein
MTASDTLGASLGIAEPVGPSGVVAGGRAPGRVGGAVTSTLIYVASITAALVISAVLVWATGGSASAVFRALLDGSIRSPGAWGLTLTTMAPLLLVAVGTIVATKAGLVNIGQEGQLLMGACFGAFIAVRLPGPGPMIIVCSILFAGIGGALWAGVAALLKAWRNVPEVLTTLLLAFVAFPVSVYGLRQEWLIADRDHTRVNHINSGEQIPASAKLPDLRILGNAIDTSTFLAVGIAGVVAAVLARTWLGSRITVLGLNPRAAQRFGVAQRPLAAAALVFSGFLAGTGGAVLLHGGAAGDRLTAGYSGNVGWDGLLVALLARNRVMLAVPMAFVFAALRTGSSFLASTGVDRKMTDVVQALLVLALLVPPAITFVLDQRRARRVAVAEVAA